MFKYAHAYAHKCLIFHTCVGIQWKPTNLLELVIINGPFQQWGIDVIGEINRYSSMQHRCILTVTDYFTRWGDAVPLKQVNTNRVIEFLEYNIIMRFGTPLTLVFDNASYFSSFALSQLSLDRGIKIRCLANYYLQGNGLVEPTNKNRI